MENWIHERLSDCLGFSVPEDLVQYVISIEGNRDIEDYLGTLLDFKNPKHRLFLSDFLQRRSNTSKSASNTSNNQQTNKKKKNKNSASNAEVEQKATVAVTKENDERSNSAKKKSKFVSLYSPEAKNVILLKGRHHCDCQASKHKLINNCLQCGRVVCEQEGSGPCLVCGNLVCSKEEQQVLGGGTRRADALYNRLMEQKRPAGWEQALAQRNRLLEYDRTSEKRTQVIDDESDYFMSSSVWLSKNEREKLQKHEKEMRERRHASRLSQKVTLDFAGRQIVQEADLDPEIEENLLREIAKNSDKQRGIIDSQFPSLKTGALGDNVHPDLEGPAPVFDDSVVKTAITYAAPEKNENNNTISRVQDRELQEMSDRGVCLSMHQPWASLLISGIKRHEGRSWYTSHRGRLWIASTVKPIDLKEKQEIENMYKMLYNDENMIFPEHYPSGCLLGCVSVTDCIPQEEYRNQYPDGESDSPYVFICNDPQELPIRFPVKGQHKIYKLDSKIHYAGVKSLQRLAKLKAEA